VVVGIQGVVRGVNGSAPFVDACREGALIPVKLLGIDIAVVALAQNLLDAFKFLGQISEVLFVGSEDTFLNGLKFQGAERLNTDAEASGPGHSDAFGDVEVLGDTIAAPAFGAEFDEFVFGFVGVHGIHN
jgi:hypothetical protein